MVDLFFRWYFFELPPKIKKIWANYLWFFAHYFAVFQLAKEFFAPWKNMTFSREKRSFEIGDAFFAWFSNIISRILGAVVRSFFLAIGLAVETAVFLAGIAAFLIWLGLFFILPLLFVFAAKISVS